VEAIWQGWVVDVLPNRKGGAFHCTTRRLGGLLISSPGDSSVAYTYHTIQVWGIGGDDVGLIQSTTAPKGMKGLFAKPKQRRARDSKRSQGSVARHLQLRKVAIQPTGTGGIRAHLRGASFRTHAANKKLMHSYHSTDLPWPTQ
jgi:hypothetical protein